MCLQDVQLARAVRFTEYTVTNAAPGQVQVLGKDESRVGLFLLGPSAGTVTAYLGGTGAEFIATSFTATGGHNVRSITLLDDGYIVTEPLWIETSLAATMTVVEYTLPFDPSQLATLAANGRW